MTASTTSGTDARRLQRAGYALAGASAAATLFALAPRTDAVRFVAVPLPVVAVLLVVAVLGFLGARVGRPLVLAGAAAIGIGAAVLQMLQFGRDTNWLGGNGSTAAFLAALGIGFGALWHASRYAAAAGRAHADHDHDRADGDVIG